MNILDHCSPRIRAMMIPTPLPTLPLTQIHSRLSYRKNTYRDPVLYALLTPRSGIRIRDGEKFGSGSKMNISDNFSKSLGTVLGLKYTNSLIRIRDRDRCLLDPGSRIWDGKIRIRPNPQHIIFIIGAASEIPLIDSEVNETIQCNESGDFRQGKTEISRSGTR
jgi:hypothetical protein